jgi:hypothetical protein
MQLFGKLTELLHIIFAKDGKTIKIQPTQATVDENQTFSLPDLGTTDAHILVTESLGQSLTNKTLGTTNTITGAKAASFSNVAGDATISLPTTTDTLVGRATSDTLTNKTIDGDDNTIQDLALAAFKTAAPNAYKLLQRSSSGAVAEAGTDAVLLPSGTTAQRPTASESMARYNSTLQLVEFYNGSMWKQLSSQSQMVHVATSGAPFTSIQAAIDSITDASVSKPYVVHIAPGIYTENITLKDYVYLENGISGGVKIVGTVTATGLTGSSGIRGCTLEFTPTMDGQAVLTQSGGGFYLTDTDIYTVGTADFATTGLSLSCTTGISLFNSTVFDRRSGNITKNYIGMSCAGTGVYGIFNASVSARGAYTAGTHALVSLTQTGSFTMSGGALIFGGTATFSGTVRGISVTSISASPRITSGVQIRLTGTSGGTAVGFRLAASGDDFQHVNSVVFIDGFTSEYVTDTATGDVQKIWLNSVNKDIPKTGSGIAIITPYDKSESGFVEFAGNPAEGSTTFWSWASPNLTVSLAGAGSVKGAPVTWAASQSIALTDLATNYIYMNSAGVIQKTTASSEALYTGNILLLQAWRDGTNALVVKENHPLKFTSAVSHAWHRLFGVLLEGTGAQINILSSASRTIEILGDDVLTDHGLDTTIPAAPGTAATFSFVYTGTAGAARLQATQNTFGDWIDSGTSAPGTITNNRYVVHRVGVTKNNLNATTPQYISIIPTAEYSTLSQAQAAISAGSIQPFPTEIKNLETAQLGYVILRKTSGGSLSINSVVVERQTFTARFLGSTPANQASLITVEASAYSDADAVLDSTDVTAQAAFDHIYAVAVKQSATIDTAEADGVPRYTSTDGRSIGVATTPVKQSSTGVLTVQNTTASTDKDTGALIVQGGVGVEEDVYAGGQVVAPTVSGTTKVTTPTLAPVSANTVIDIDTNAAINLPSGTTAQRPGTAALGDFRFNTTELKLEVCTAAGTPGEWSAAGSGGTVIKVAQAGIGTGTFVGQALYLAGSTWTLANHTTAVTAEVVGLISKITDSGNIELTLGGEVTGVAFADVFETTPADGDVVWLGTTTGKLTTTAPTTVGYILKPQGVVRSKGASTCSVMYCNMRGDTVGGSNLYSTIGLANNATTTFYTISCAAGEGGWISGTIKIDGTTDYAIPFFCFFSRQLDGTTYNVSPFYGSSTPATGFSISNSSSAVQITLPNDASFVSASVTYCVQAAASGTTLPVSVSASSVLGSTTGVAPAAGVIGEKISSSAIIDTIFTPANTDVSVKTTGGTDPVTLVLTPGNWRIEYSVPCYYATGTTAGNKGYTTVAITDNAGSRIAGTASGVYVQTTANAANITQVNCAGSLVVNISTTTTYKLYGKYVDSYGTGSAALDIGAGSFDGYFFATRIG